MAALTSDRPQLSLAVRVASSPINYWAALITDAVAAAVFGVVGAIWYSGSLLVAAVLVPLGFLLWGFFEYVLHRWVLHGFHSPARREHSRHHGQPRAPISTPCLVIPFLAVVMCALLASVMPRGAAALLTFGIYLGYNYFAIVHHLQHHRPGALSGTWFFGRQLRLHEVHHQHPHVYFGISTSIWDHVFGTVQRTGKPRSRFLQHDEIVVEQPGS